MHASISLHQRRHYSSTRTMLLKFCSADSEILKFVWKHTSYRNLLHRDSNHKKLSGSTHKTSNLVKNYCIPQKELWSATKCHKKVTKDYQSREASRINNACMCVRNQTPTVCAPSSARKSTCPSGTRQLMVLHPCHILKARCCVWNQTDCVLCPPLYSRSSGLFLETLESHWVAPHNLVRIR